jgi:beta-glucosidase
LYFRDITGKCKVLKRIRTAERGGQIMFGWPTLRGARRIGVAAAAALLFGLCAFAQSASTSPDQIERRIDSILSQMTIEEKIDLLGGVDGFYVRGVPRLSVPRFKMADGPLGVRNYGPATTMAGGIGLAATWNPALAEQVGTEIGRDARAKGVHFLLGPGVNIYRAPMNGRNFEYFGEDPFLASRITVGYIKGVQSQGVSATVKHFMGNNSEFDRHNTDSVIDERTMREIYLPVFEAAVKEAHVGAIMDSYNLTDGIHLTQSSYLNGDVAKKEWGFNGIIMSDWTSTYDAVAAANAGLDVEMPSGEFLNRKNLLPAIQEGKVSVATIDDKVRRILRVAAQFGWLDREQTDLSVPRYNQQGRQVALQTARESMVLLKNGGPLLPLSKSNIKSVAVIGPNSYPAVPVGGGSARVQPFASVSFLQGLGNYLGTAVPVYCARGIPSLDEMAKATKFSTAAGNGQPGMRAEYFGSADLTGSPLLIRTELHVAFGGVSGQILPEHTLSDRFTGYYSPERSGLYDVFVESSGEDGGFYRLYVDGQLVFDNWTVTTALMNSISLQFEATSHKFVLEHHGRSHWLGAKLRLGIVPHDGVVDQQAKLLAAKADLVVVAVGFDPETESEGADRIFRLPPGQEQLIQEMGAANKNVVVVITAGGAVDMNSWLDRVPAVLQAWYPGQEGGTALAEILFGEVNPSGRLPVSFERRWEDNPVHDSYYPQGNARQVVYKEGVFVGYRGYERNGKKPLFPFGYGLSYTSFTYSNLSVVTGTTKGGSNSVWWAEVAFDVTNTGKREGAEVAQVYVSDKHSKLERPAKELKGFVKVNLKAGEKRRVKLMLDERALSYYDVSSKRWRAEPGQFEVLVGSSSENIQLQGRLTLGDTHSRQSHKAVQHTAYNSACSATGVPCMSRR